MPFRLRESSSDVVLEADGPDLGSVLVELARGFSHITTAGSPIQERERVPFEVESEGDLARLAVAFVNELVFRFATQQFLPAGGTFGVEQASPNGWRASGELAGEPFDPRRHALGTEVKAATLHEARFEAASGGARARLLLDL